MRYLMRLRFGLLVLLGLQMAGVSYAYTRAYVVNNTGQAAFSLHVKLTQAAMQGTAGVNNALFNTVKMSADGMTIDFTSPVDPQGIEAGETLWIGWLDANPQLSGAIQYYYFTDLAGNVIGGFQTPPPGDTGLLTPMGGPTGPGGTNFTGPGGDTNNPTPTDNSPGTDPNPPGNQDPTPPTSSNPGGTDPPGGTNNPPSNQLQAAPEPGSMLLIAGGLLLLCGSVRRRNRNRAQ